MNRGEERKTEEQTGSGKGSEGEEKREEDRDRCGQRMRVLGVMDLFFHLHNFQRKEWKYW